MAVVPYCVSSLLTILVLGHSVSEWLWYLVIFLAY